MDSQTTTDPVKIKHDWYQTDSHVIITLFIKNVTQENLKVNYHENEVVVSVCGKEPSDSELSARFNLFLLIRPNECSSKIFSTKIELKLKKQECIRWSSLEENKSAQNIKHFSSEENSVCPARLPEYPSSAAKKHDWNKLEAEVKQEEEKEKPEGDAALNQLFQKIYADGNEEVRKAMNKSYMESGGTVLSTNWKEVGDKSVEVKAPDGMEWKKWEK